MLPFLLLCPPPESSSGLGAGWEKEEWEEGERKEGKERDSKVGKGKDTGWLEGQV